MGSEWRATDDGRWAVTGGEGEMLSRLLGLEIGTALIQEICQTREQRPETDDGCGAHQLIVVRAQEVFEILKEDLDILYSHVHLALEGYSFLFADGFLAVQSRVQGTATTQQDAQTGKEAMSLHHPP